MIMKWIENVYESRVISDNLLVIQSLFSLLSQLSDSSLVSLYLTYLSHLQSYFKANSPTLTMLKFIIYILDTPCVQQQAPHSFLQ